MLGYFCLAAWVIFLLFGMVKNYAHYSAIDWIAILLTLLVPCFLFYKYKTRKSKATTSLAKDKQPYLPLKIFGVFIFSLICIIGLSQLNKPDGSNNLLGLLLCGFIALVLLNSIIKSNKKIQETVVIRDEQRKTLLTLLENYPKCVIQSPSIVLRQNESAYLEQMVALLITQNKIVGSSGRSSGASIRVAKGVYLRSGGSRSQRIYKDVTTRYTGSLSITNQRIAFMHSQKAFEIPLEKLTNITSSHDTLVLQQANKSYTLELLNADLIEQLIRKLCVK